VNRTRASIVWGVDFRYEYGLRSLCRSSKSIFVRPYFEATLTIRAGALLFNSGSSSWVSRKYDR
jgi:hypothetical protein